MAWSFQRSFELLGLKRHRSPFRVRPSNHIPAVVMPDCSSLETHNASSVETVKHASDKSSQEGHTFRGSGLRWRRTNMSLKHHLLFSIPTLVSVCIGHCTVKVWLRGDYLPLLSLRCSKSQGGWILLLRV